MKLHLVSLGLAAAWLCTAALANPAVEEFPAGATVPTATELKSKLEASKFTVPQRDGSAWRVEFNNAGYFFVNTGQGFNGSGTWRTEDGRLCSQLRGGDAVCNDARVHDGLVHVRRSNGQIVKYVPR